MANGADTNSEKPGSPASASPEKQDAQTTPGAAGQDLMTKNFQEELAKKREAHEKKIEEQKKKFRLPSSIGKANVDMMEARQINRVRQVSREKEQAFAQTLAAQKAERMQLILGEAETEMMKISEGYAKIIDYVRGLNKLDEQEMVKLEAMMEALSRMKADPKMEAIFQKSLNKSTLAPEEMGYLIDRINPVSLEGTPGQPPEGGGQEKQPQINQIFEAGEAGAIISVLKDGPQFMDFMEMLIAKKPPQEAAKILEIFLTVGVLSNLQLQNLIDRGVVREPAASILRKQLEQGELSRKQQEYQKLQEARVMEQKGRTADNPLNKTFSGPGAMALAGLWGIATALVNIKAGWQKGAGFGKNLADALTNPYVLMGATAAVGSVMVVAPVVAPETYEKYKDKFLDFWKGPEEKQRDLGIEQQELRQMLEAQLVRNPYLLAYLEQKEEFPGGRHLTGMEVIKEMVAKQLADGKEVSFNFREMISQSLGKQKELLTKAMAQEGGKDINFEDTMRAVMASLRQLKLDNPAAIAQLSADIKRKQGIK